MAITVTCRRCSHEFSAWEDLAGQLVQCPKCEADVYVGDNEDEWEDEEDEDDEEDEFQLAPPEESLLSPTSTALPLADEEQPETEAPVDEVPEDCPKCGAELKGELLCHSCNYHVKLRRVLASDLDTFEPDQNLGFKRWFNSQLSEGESFDSVLFWAAIVFGFLLFGFTFIFFPFSLCLTIPILIGVIGGYFFLKSSAKRGDDAFYDAGTRFSLKVIRTLGWRKLSWPFPKVRHFTSGPDFGDEDLAEMELNPEVEALDLESSRITDAGLVHLADWEHLRYLVLLNTDTTQEAVIELQFQLKKTMIWY